MKNIYILVLALSFLFQSFEMAAQQGTVIRGRVTDQATGEPLPGVNIVEMDDQNRVVKGVITDVNGNYVFEVSNAQHTIQVSFVGYEAQTFKINGRSRINVALEPQTLGIEQVTVTAESRGDDLTGVADRDQTGSSMKVDMEKLSGQAGVSAASALQGQVSGLDIISASGAPGSGSNIVIRGMGSLGNTNPLIVVDGIPQDIETEQFNFASADQHDLGQLLSIAPQDIASVEVLKDAASTAVWGSKGANGVLLIETNKGTKGNIQFAYDYKASANIQPPPIPMLNGDEYITLQLEEWHNAEGNFDIPQEIAYDRNFVDFHNYTANTDWVNRITQDSYTHDHFFKMSGGGEKSNYYASVNYQDEGGTTTNTSFQRFSVRVNFDYNISDNLRFTTNFTYTNNFREQNPEIFGVVVGDKWNRWMNVRQMGYIKSPNMSVWEYDQQGNPTGDYFTPIETYQGRGSDYFNPIAISNLGMNDTRKNEVQNNFKINYTITDWLIFKESISFSYINNKGNKFLPSAAIGADWLYYENNSAQERNSINNRLLSRSQFFIRPFRAGGDHSLTGVLMWEMEDSKSQFMNMSQNRGPTMFITDPAQNAPVGGIKSGSTHTRMFGALSSISYKFKDRYLLNANLRADGSSAFGQRNQWGLFPSLSLGWRFSDENFLQGLNFLNESKIRLSWGESGKKINKAYASYAYYSTFNQYMGEQAIIPNQIELANLRWQTVTTWNAGIDINMFDNRLYIQAETYKKLTSDLLWDDYNIPTSTGYRDLDYFNGGELQNIGWEYFMRGTLIQQKNFQLSLNFNTSQNINSFKSFPENFKKDKGSSIGNGEYPRKAEVGKPIGSFYGFRYLGVYPSDEDAVARDENGEILTDSKGKAIPMSFLETYEFKGGDAMYEDINHDGKIDILDAVYIGDSSPEFIGGFGTNIRYKQLSASVSFHYRLGFDIINQVAADTEGMLNRSNQSKAVLYRWKRQGMDYEGLLPRAYMDHPSNNLGSDRYVEKGDFLRLNNVSITYRLKQDIAERFNLNNMSVRLVARNLLTFTNYSGQDPEIGRVGLDPFFLGTDKARTPPPRVYSLAFNFQF